MSRSIKNMTRLVARWMACLTLALCSVQCRGVDNRVVSSDVNIGDWNERVELIYENSTAATRCDVDVVLHVNRNFTEREIPLEITFFTPDSLRYSECVELKAQAEWDGVADYYTDIVMPYRGDVSLAKEGTYRLTIRPLKSLSGVESAGVNFRLK